MAVFMNAVQSNPEGVDMAASIDQVKDVTSLGDLPLTVITAGMPSVPPCRMAVSGSYWPILGWNPN